MRGRGREGGRGVRIGHCGGMEMRGEERGLDIC